MHRGWLVALVVCVAAPARAEPARHAAYVDVLGKAGLWGVGYDYELAPRFALGAVGSYYVLGGDHYTALAPYATVYPFGSGRLRALVQLGPQLVHHSTPSPVPEWDGMTTTRFGAALCGGIEYRRRIVVRGYGMLAVGEHVAPWLGLSIGWAP
jgi:hypothetical protein